jgi:hypothetical protein
MGRNELMTITLIVEDGSKPDNANSYVTLEAADLYHGSYGNIDWPAPDSSEEEKKQALILATQSVDLLYGPRYLSFIYPDSPQVLLFPRAWFTDNNGVVVPDNTIPICLINAVCEVALMSLQGIDIFPLASSANYIKAESVKVGGVAIEQEYWLPKTQESYESFGKVDLLLYPILKSKGGSSGGWGMWRLVA